MHAVFLPELRLFAEHVKKNDRNVIVHQFDILTELFCRPRRGRIDDNKVDG